MASTPVLQKLQTGTFSIRRVKRSGSAVCSFQKTFLSQRFQKAHQCCKSSKTDTFSIHQTCQVANESSKPFDFCRRSSRKHTNVAKASNKHFLYSSCQTMKICISHLPKSFVLPRLQKAHQCGNSFKQALSRFFVTNDRTLQFAPSKKHFCPRDSGKHISAAKASNRPYLVSADHLVRVAETLSRKHTSRLHPAQIPEQTSNPRTNAQSDLQIFKVEILNGTLGEENQFACGLMDKALVFVMIPPRACETHLVQFRVGAFSHFQFLICSFF